MNMTKIIKLLIHLIQLLNQKNIMHLRYNKELKNKDFLLTIKYLFQVYSRKQQQMLSEANQVKTIK
ncbi:unnamed protein product [Paramecium sonneborni]|uniref:Uncharacterized protein n=1 Tax=Paramecium sonneborni TaxID=65129 RepID=A0A8S1QSY2_9CILI|nr:unnamed protein product [Paramecium sonneborni]